MRFASLVPALLAGSFLLSMNASAEELKPRKNIIEVLKDADKFSTLLSAIDKAGYTQVLEGKDKYTVFAPIDAAFARIPSDQLSNLLQDQVALRRTLAHHAIAGRKSVRALMRLDSVTALDGTVLKLQRKGHRLYVDGHRVLRHYHASNGIVHVIGAVLTPAAATSAAPAVPAGETPKPADERTDATPEPAVGE